MFTPLSIFLLFCVGSVLIGLPYIRGESWDPKPDKVVIPASPLLAARLGEHDRAIAALQKLLSIPSNGALAAAPLTPALLRLAPMFDSLRNDPRFQKLAQSLPPNSAKKTGALPAASQN